MIKVVSISVAHHPNPALLFRQIMALRSQVDSIVIVDNASNNGEDWHAGASIDAQLIRQKDNKGLSAAQNIGIRHALLSGATHVLLMDHDSVPSAGMVSRLLAADSSLRAANVSFAAVGPVCIDRRTGKIFDFVKSKAKEKLFQDIKLRQEYLVEVDFLIASGTLISAQAFDTVGLMNEGFFIDHIDTEWCLRARVKGLRLFGVPDAFLDHCLGDQVVQVWLRRWRSVAVHSPMRNYYMLRNTVLMLQSVPMSWAWRVSHIWRITRYAVFFSLAITPRWNRVFHMAKGLWHGLTGHTGKINESPNPGSPKAR